MTLNKKSKKNGRPRLRSRKKKSNKGTKCRSTHASVRACIINSKKTKKKDRSRLRSLCEQRKKKSNKGTKCRSTHASVRACNIFLYIAGKR